MAKLKSLFNSFGIFTKSFSVVIILAFCSKAIDFIFIDSLHEPKHIKKVFYHYYKYLTIGGICIIDDISWIPYSENEYRDNEFTEIINRSSFQIILEIYNQNKDNLMLEFYLLIMKIQ